MSAHGSQRLVGWCGVGGGGTSRPGVTLGVGYVWDGSVFCGWVASVFCRGVVVGCGGFVFFVGVWCVFVLCFFGCV